MPLEELLASGVAVPIVRWGNPVLHRPARLPAPRSHVEDEGCLSLPGAYLPIARSDTAACRGQDQFGQSITVRGTGTLARCLQHETEHLDGVVLEDHLTPQERYALRRQHSRVADRYSARWPVD